MNRLLLKIVMIGAGGSLLVSNSMFSQIIPPTKKAAHVEIVQGPTLEFAREDFAIVRWTTNNPGGDPEHFAIAHFGTNPKELNRTAKTHIQVNQEHPQTMFRVRIEGLTPRTTYYYTVTSIESSGASDGVTSPVEHFTTPGPGERFEAFPQPAQQPK
jgi:Purple acid Phosphatase, N-terminal domain